LLKDLFGLNILEINWDLAAVVEMIGGFFTKSVDREIEMEDLMRQVVINLRFARTLEAETALVNLFCSYVHSQRQQKSIGAMTNWMLLRIESLIADEKANYDELLPLFEASVKFFEYVLPNHSLLMSKRVLELVMPCIHSPHEQVRLFAVQVLSVISPRLLRNVGIELLAPVVALLAEDDDLVALPVARFFYDLSIADEEFFRALGIDEAVTHRLEAMDAGPSELGDFLVALLLSWPLEQSHYQLIIPRFPIVVVPAVFARVYAWAVAELGRGTSPEVAQVLLTSIIRLFARVVPDESLSNELVREMAAAMGAAAESPNFEGLVAAVLRDNPDGLAAFQKSLGIAGSVTC
jgi:hypothetical protein